MRQVVLDTETTGLDASAGHRIIEVGCVELLNRKATGRHFHQYIQPDRRIDDGAIEVHGITNEFLEDKPRFGEIVEAFLEFVSGSELIIHNAPFDVGFINAELARLEGGIAPIHEQCAVIDTLAEARRMFPGQKNNLDALCRRYDIDNSGRDLHGALLDARILADVYLAMTGGQVSLSLTGGPDAESGAAEEIRRVPSDRRPLRIIHASEEELLAHEARLRGIDKASGGKCIWLRED